jgi:hypothetical protein
LASAGSRERGRPQRAGGASYPLHHRSTQTAEKVHCYTVSSSASRSFNQPPPRRNKTSAATTQSRALLLALLDASSPPPLPIRPTFVTSFSSLFSLDHPLPANIQSCVFHFSVQGSTEEHTSPPFLPGPQVPSATTASTTSPSLKTVLVDSSAPSCPL